jgi:hypothetical protein
VGENDPHGFVARLELPLDVPAASADRTLDAVRS